MSSANCFSLDKSKILSSGNGLKLDHIIQNIEDIVRMRISYHVVDPIKQKIFIPGKFYY